MVNLLNLTLKLFLVVGFLVGCNEINKAPVAVLEVDITDGILPLSVNFSAVKSYDSDGKIVSYQFDFGDGSNGGNGGSMQTVTTSLAASKISHSYTLAGEYYAKVTVIDDKGAKTSSQQLLIRVVRTGAGEIEFGEATYVGDGCPHGSVATMLAPNNQAISIMFDDFSVEIGEGSKELSDSMLMRNERTCSLSIPITPPSGYSVAVFRFDYRGFAEIPIGNKGIIETKYSFLDGNIKSFSYDFSRAPSSVGNKFSDNFFLSNNLASNGVVWSQCNQTLNLQIENRLLVEREDNSSSDNPFTSIILDSIDGVTAVTYYFGIKECEKI
ncbi:MAG: DUF4360 domain-containing protein [Oligoflexia bacterium]|nr:DUF4360 domain-containing protein [Oligoflexia bacterium]